MGSRPGRNKQPAKTTAPEYAEVLDAASFWRRAKQDADKNGVSVIFGVAGGPLVIYGDQDGKHSHSELPPFLDREQVAEALGCHPDKLSWKPYREKMEAEGLIGRKLAGSRKKWRREDVLAYAERKGLTGKRKPGRPRKYP